jgi:hypothetical protein
MAAHIKRRDRTARARQGVRVGLEAERCAGGADLVVAMLHTAERFKSRAGGSEWWRVRLRRDVRHARQRERLLGGRHFREPWTVDA